MVAGDARAVFEADGVPVIGQAQYTGVALNITFQFLLPLTPI